MHRNSLGKKSIFTNRFIDNKKTGDTQFLISGLINNGIEKTVFKKAYG